VGAGHPSSPLSIYFLIFYPVLLFSFFHWLYPFFSFVHPFPFYQNSPTPTSTSLPADVTDDSCAFKYIEIVPLTRDTDGACTTECDSGLLKSNKVPIVGNVHELAHSDNVATTQRSQLITSAQQIKHTTKTAKKI